MELKLRGWDCTSCQCSEPGACWALPVMDQCRNGSGETPQQQMAAAAFPSLLPSPWAKFLHPFQCNSKPVKSAEKPVNQTLAEPLVCLNSSAVELTHATLVYLHAFPQSRQKILFFIFVSLDLGQLNRGQIRQAGSKLQQKNELHFNLFPQQSDNIIHVYIPAFATILLFDLGKVTSSFWTFISPPACSFCL